MLVKKSSEDLLKHIYNICYLFSLIKLVTQINLKKIKIYVGKNNKNLYWKK